MDERNRYGKCTVSACTHTHTHAFSHLFNGQSSFTGNKLIEADSVKWKRFSVIRLWSSVFFYFSSFLWKFWRGFIHIRISSNGWTLRHVQLHVHTFCLFFNTRKQMGRVNADCLVQMFVRTKQNKTKKNEKKREPRSDVNIFFLVSFCSGLCICGNWWKWLFVSFSSSSSSLLLKKSICLCTHFAWLRR